MRVRIVICLLASVFSLAHANDEAMCEDLDTSLFGNGPPMRAQFYFNESCECGIMGDGVGTRIVGGTEVTPHLFPWAVAILYNNRLHCGGSLINDRYVLTAGHCIDRWQINLKGLRIILGMHDRIAPSERSQQEAFISCFILHRNFAVNRGYGDIADIALIRLQYPVQYNSFVSPVCLPKQVDRDYSSFYGVVAGWGHLSDTADLSRYLLMANVRILTTEECKNSSIGNFINDAMMCTYHPGKDACQGDSGGPLLYSENPFKMEQIGVVSWGIGCASPGVPGVYTRVTEYLNWISVNTMDAVYCSRG